MSSPLRDLSQVSFSELAKAADSDETNRYCEQALGSLKTDQTVKNACWIANYKLSSDESLGSALEKLKRVAEAVFKAMKFHEIRIEGVRDKNDLSEKKILEACQAIDKKIENSADREEQELIP